MLINLLNTQPKKFDASQTRRMDATFGHDYFDGTRDQGYGGYKYDGRWKAIADILIKRYNLKAGSRVLDLGCAKGFLLHELLEACPGIEVHGLDVSEYALSQALPSVKPHLQLGSAESLKFPDHYFDFISAMNTFHFLTPEKTDKAFREMMRVGKNSFFIQVDSFENDEGRRRLLAWAPIIKTVYSVDQWQSLFKTVGYQGDYYWTII